MKEKNMIICPKCGCKNTKRYGKRNGIQRYKCNSKDCNYTFLETRKRTAYSYSKKALFSMLYNLLKFDCETTEITVDEAIEKVDISNIKLHNFRIIQRTVSDVEKIECYNPRLLICDDYDRITIYKIEPRRTKEEKCRTISIIDDDANSKLKYIFKEKFEREKRLKNFLPPQKRYWLKKALNNKKDTTFTKADQERLNYMERLLNTGDDDFLEYDD